MSMIITTDNRVPLPVIGHVAVSINNMVLVWGGYTSPDHLQLIDFEFYIDPKLLWIYHPEYDHWQMIVTKGDIPEGTSGAGIVHIDNSLYVFGGFSDHGNVNCLYRLHLSDMTWHQIKLDDNSVPSPRDKFMCWSHEESLYVFGGFGIPIRDYICDNGEFVIDEGQFSGYRGWNNQLCVFDTKKGFWSNPKCLGSVPAARAAGATACIDNKLYLFGGRHQEHRLNDLHVLQLDTLIWTKLEVAGVSPCGRSWHTMTPISSTHLVMYGGFSSTQLPMCDVWILDIELLTWSQYQPRSEIPARLWHTMVYTDDNDLVVFGGCSNDILSSDSPAKSHNDVITIRFCPKSLLRLCLDISHSHRSILESEFISLPKTLQQKLERRESADSVVELDSTDITRTCAIS